MNRYRPFVTGFRNQNGVAAILVALLLFVLVGFAAMAVDVGYYMVTRNDLQNIADATALYGARILGHNYQGMTNAEQQAYVCDPSEIVPGVQEVGLANYAGDLDGIIINAGDVLIGQWDSSATPRFTQTLNQPDAVSVTVRREGGTNGPLSTLFARVLGINTFDVSADATAALTGQGQTGEGDLELPVGISNCFFDDNCEAAQGCNNFVAFAPTNHPDSCAGWTSWDYGSNDVTLRRILDEVDGYESPERDVGVDSANFTGGTLSNPTFDAMMNLFERKGCDWDPINLRYVEYVDNDVNGECVPGHNEDYGIPLYDEDGVTRLLYPDGTERNHHRWETLVIVYGPQEGEEPSCENPNTRLPILGFATIVLTDVRDAPEKTLIGQILCQLVDNDLDGSRGGGGNYGTLGSIPGLVE